MTSKTLNRYKTTMPEVTRNFKINVFLKKVLGVYLVKYSKVKNGVFSIFKVNKCGKKVVFAPYSYVPGGLEGLFDFFDSSTTIPGQALPPPIVGAPSSF